MSNTTQSEAKKDDSKKPTAGSVGQLCQACPLARLGSFVDAGDGLCKYTEAASGMLYNWGLFGGHHFGGDACLTTTSEGVPHFYS